MCVCSGGLQDQCLLKLLEGWRHLDVMASLQPLLTLDEVVHTIHHCLHQLDLKSLHQISKKQKKSYVYPHKSPFHPQNSFLHHQNSSFQPQIPLHPQNSILYHFISPTGLIPPIVRDDPGWRCQTLRPRRRCRLHLSLSSAGAGC